MKTTELVLVILFCVVIASCGGGGGGSITTTQTLSGTAAQGAAIEGATVTIKDRNGSTTTGTTGTDGKYSIDVTGKTAPFLLKVPAGTGFLYSVSTATGVANIHPFTDLIIRNWYKVQGADVETDFSGTGALAKIPPATEINTIEAAIRNTLSTNLTSVGITASNFNLLTSSFDANHTGFDKVLDNTKVAVSTTGAVTVTATDPTTGITGTVVSTNLTTDLAAADITKPSDPSGLFAIPAGATFIALVWNASTDNVGVAGYNIYRGATIVGASPYPIYSDIGLTSSTNYCYQVAAIDGAGNMSAAKSAQVCATTLAAADTTAPSAPTVLTATVASASQIDLSWAASTSTDVAGYAIYRDGIKIAAVNGTSYSDTGLSSGTTYSYTVKAMDGALNYSAASNAASATPATTASLVGTWGEVTLYHNNDGTWSTEVCKFTYNNNNTGAATCQWNYDGTLETGAPDTFTYSAVSDPDGSLTTTKTFASDGAIRTHRWVIGDDGKAMILDGTTLMDKQRFRVAVKLDTTKTYSNANLNGDYYFNRYRYDGQYSSRSGIETFDGVGGRNYNPTINADGVISYNVGPTDGTYNISSDGLYTVDNANTGYLSGDGKFGVNTHVNDPATWSFGLSMKKGDKTYSTADLAGTWAYSTFGDNGGTSFSVQFATMTCDSSGNCSTSEKIQTDGSVTYQSSATTLSVASDGSITDANNVSKISAIGNNGNTIIVNNSFDPNNSGKRRIGIFIKCSACLNF